MGLLTGPSTGLRDITATNVSAGNQTNIILSGATVNPSLQKLVAACLDEIDQGETLDTFIEQLAHYGRVPTERNLESKLTEAGCNSKYYDFAIEAKESFAKFYEVMGRHRSGQAILVTAFKHAYSVFREQIYPRIDEITFDVQASLFDDKVINFLSDNLIGLPNFDGRMEALGLLFFLADNCFIEYAKCST
ncbi:ABC-three component system protein [Novosphingobium sp. PhB57]|uniref:ABC-three component system protein n=1 Tax=Novosphingobium sp. PhB57 TaxID=2485107 RepID=UPI001051FDEE|nr:ABC-three component system protein [Novosphingobium sp. PhB57]